MFVGYCVYHFWYLVQFVCTCKMMFCFDRLAFHQWQLFTANQVTEMVRKSILLCSVCCVGILITSKYLIYAWNILCMYVLCSVFCKYSLLSRFLYNCKDISYASFEQLRYATHTGNIGTFDQFVIIMWVVADTEVQSISQSIHLTIHQWTSMVPL